MRYDFSRMSSDSFELMVRRLNEKIFGAKCEQYGMGPDGQREFVFEGSIIDFAGIRFDGRTVGQVKYKHFKSKEDDYAWLVREIDKELRLFRTKDKEYIPDNYLFYTNVVFTPMKDKGVKDRVNAYVEKHNDIIKNFYIRGYDEICAMLDNNRDVAISYEDLILPGDILAGLHREYCSEKGSFAEYIDSQRILQTVYHKLDYRSEEIPFVGRGEALKEIEEFCSSDEKILWWAVVGSGGSGKSRLAYHFIKENIGSADWKMLFLQGDFWGEDGEEGRYKAWNNWAYGKHLLLVVDYVQKYAVKAAQWIRTLNNSRSVSNKIGVLFLERTGTDNSLWYKGIFDRPIVSELKYKKDFLNLKSLEEELIEFAFQYAEKHDKTISRQSAEEALEKLKAIDTDIRILYYIMILEAVLEGKSWRNWDKEQFISYIVDREEKLIYERFGGNRKLIQCYCRLLAFCTATKALQIFNLSPDIPSTVKEDVEVISNTICNKNEICAVMQLKNNALQPITPDIIGEYITLSMIDQYFLQQTEKEEFISSLWTYDPGNFCFFVYRVMGDKIYGNHVPSEFDEIINLMVFKSIPLQDIHAVEYYAHLLWGLTEGSDFKQITAYVDRLEQLYDIYPASETVARSYAATLFDYCYFYYRTDNEKIVEKMEEIAERYMNNEVVRMSYANGLLLRCSEYINQLTEFGKPMAKLVKLAEKYGDHEGLQIVYANELVNLSYLQELPDIQETKEKLVKLSGRFQHNAFIQFSYARVLSWLGMKQDLSDKRNTAKEFEILSESYMQNKNIQVEYANFLLDLSAQQEVHVVRTAVRKLEDLAERNADNTKIITAYAYGLINLCAAQALSDRKRTLQKLTGLIEKLPNEERLHEKYAIELSKLYINKEQWKIREDLKLLADILEKFPDNQNIQIAYANVIEMFIYEQDISEFRKNLILLTDLAKKSETGRRLRTCNYLQVNMRKMTELCLFIPMFCMEPAFPVNCRSGRRSSRSLECYPENIGKIMIFRKYMQRDYTTCLVCRMCQYGYRHSESWRRWLLAVETVKKSKWNMQKA